MKKEIEHIYYWNNQKNKPRIIQFQDTSLALYTPETLLIQFIQREKQISFYENGQIKQFTFNDGYTEEYDENGLLKKSYTSHHFSDLGLTQKHICEYTHSKKGKLKWAEGIIQTINADGKIEELERTFLNPQDCPSHAKISQSHFNEIIRFLEELPHTSQNRFVLQHNYKKNYGDEDSYRKRIRFLIENQIPVCIRE